MSMKVKHTGVCRVEEIIIIFCFRFEMIPLVMKSRIIFLLIDIIILIFIKY